MANVCSVPQSYIYLRGQGAKIFSLIAKECDKNDIRIPTLETPFNPHDELKEFKEQSKEGQFSKKNFSEIIECLEGNKEKKDIKWLDKEKFSKIIDTLKEKKEIKKWISIENNQLKYLFFALLEPKLKNHSFPFLTILKMVYWLKIPFLYIF